MTMYGDWGVGLGTGTSTQRRGGRVVGNHGATFLFGNGCTWHLRVHRLWHLGVRCSRHHRVYCRMQHLYLGSVRGTLHLGAVRWGGGYNNLGGELLSGD